MPTAPDAAALAEARKLMGTASYSHDAEAQAKVAAIFKAAYPDQVPTVNPGPSRSQPAAAPTRKARVYWDGGALGVVDF